VEKVQEDRLFLKVVVEDDDARHRALHHGAEVLQVPRKDEEEKEEKQKDVTTLGLLTHDLQSERHFYITLKSFDDYPNTFIHLKILHNILWPSLRSTERRKTSQGLWVNQRLPQGSMDSL